MAYTTEIGTLGRILAKEQMPLSIDPSQNLLIYLALAFAALSELKDMGADLEFSGRPLVRPALERAYREALEVRRRLPAEHLDTGVVTRFGRYNGHAEA